MAQKTDTGERGSGGADTLRLECPHVTSAPAKSCLNLVSDTEATFAVDVFVHSAQVARRKNHLNREDGVKIRRRADIRRD